MNGQTDDLEPVAQAYRRDGFVAVPGLFGRAAVRDLLAETTAIVRGDRGEAMGAESIVGDTDEARLAKVLAIHHPHKLSPLMLAAMTHAPVARVLTALIGPDVKSMQSMLFVKAPGKPGQAWHQDEQYIPTRDRSLCGVWIALDDASIDNGCMWMHPGSHAPGVLYPTRHHGESRFDSATEAYGFPFEREGGVAVEVRAGDVVFFNGYVLHRSLPNRTAGAFRRALVVHCMSAQSLLPWPIDGCRSNDDMRDIVMVAGSDPYAWKGLEDVCRPYVRPEDPVKAAAIYARLSEAARARRV